MGRGARICGWRREGLTPINTDGDDPVQVDLDGQGVNNMARELDWTDTEEIGIQLQEMFPETDPYTVRFTDLHKWVVQLPDFVGDPAKSNEGILEAIQTAWREEYVDAKDA
jgi:FeS assembly protein IscX